MSYEAMKLSCQDPDVWHYPTRLLISSVRPINKTEAPHYEPGAFVPTIPRFASSEEITRHTAATAEDRSTVRLLTASTALKNFIDTLEGETIDSHATCEPNKLTTTRHQTTQQFVGLHIDSKDNLPNKHRVEKSRLRLGYNTGPGDRFLLLGNYSILALLNGQQSSPDFIPTTKTVREVLQNPSENFRLLWLRLRPGEAYVAPTEIAIHDGSTLGMKAVSTIFFVLDHPDADFAFL